MSIFDASNLHARKVITPLGIGTLFGVDDKDAPKKITVVLKIEGYKVPQSKVFDVDELQEVEK